jgi:hypothetical protein
MYVHLALTVPSDPEVLLLATAATIVTTKEPLCSTPLNNVLPGITVRAVQPPPRQMVFSVL